jgi:predicted transposase YbfD/YdcC
MNQAKCFKQNALTSYISKLMGSSVTLATGFRASDVINNSHNWLYNQLGSQHQRFVRDTTASGPTSLLFMIEA